MKIQALALVILTASAATAQDDVVTVEKWKVQLGDRPDWAASDFDDRDWPAGELPGGRAPGFRWYRSTIMIPPAWKDQPMALAFGPMGEAFEVYVEGVRVGRFGVLDPIPVSTFVHHLSFDLPPQSGATGTLHIAVRRWMGRAIPYFQTLTTTGRGNFDHVPRIGPARLVQTQERLHALEAEKSTALNRTQLLFGGLVGLLSLVLFAQRHDRREYLWLGLGLVLPAIAMAGIMLAVKLDLPVRSTIPALSVVIDWTSYSGLLMLMLHLCPRLRWLLGALVALFMAQGCYLAFTMIANQALPSAATILYANAITMAAQALTAILLWRNNRHGFALAASLLLVPVIKFLFWSRILHWHWRTYLWDGYYVDPDYVVMSIFAVTTLAILWLRSRAEQREQQTREQELAAGQRVQQLLLDSTGGTPGFHVERAYLPAREVGGDFYQLIPRPDGGLLAVVGDVSGKGLEAAMIGARLLGALDTLKALQPGQVLASLNEALQGRSRGFVTCCCALFSPDGTVKLANAGHLAPYMDGTEVETEAGLPLGLAEGAEYIESYVILGTKVITFLTDGIVEAENAHRELFGFERTREISSKSAGEIAEAAKAWGQTDDITVVTVRRNA